MANNRGKQFEQKFFRDFKTSFPGGTIDRIYDTTNGYKTISNISDFIGYVYPNILYLECKSHQGNTFPLINLTQYEKLKSKVGIKGVRAGVILWFIDHDRVCYVPISTIMQLKKDEKKSVNVKMLDDQSYNIIEIPSVKKRVFLDSDYTVLANLKEGE